MLPFPFAWALPLVFSAAPLAPAFFFVVATSDMVSPAAPALPVRLHGRSAARASSTTRANQWTVWNALTRKGRHGAILLPFRALAKAIEAAK